MLSGTRAFGGTEIADTLALVLTNEPQWTTLPAKTQRRFDACCADVWTKTPGDDLRLLPTRGSKSRTVARVDGCAAAAVDADPRPIHPVVASDCRCGDADRDRCVGGCCRRLRWNPPAVSRRRCLTARRPVTFWLFPRTAASWWSRPRDKADYGCASWVRLNGAAYPGPRTVRVRFGRLARAQVCGIRGRNELKKVDTTGGPPETLCPPYSSSAMGSGSWNRDARSSSAAGAAAPGGRAMESVSGGRRGHCRHRSRYHKRRAISHVADFSGRRQAFSVFPLRTARKRGHLRRLSDATPADQSHVRILATELTPSYANGYLLHARDDDDGATISPSTAATQRRPSGDSRGDTNHVVRHRSVLGVFRRCVGLSHRAGDRKRPAHLDRSRREGPRHGRITNFRGRCQSLARREARGGSRFRL